VRVCRCDDRNSLHGNLVPADETNDDDWRDDVRCSVFDSLASLQYVCCSTRQLRPGFTLEMHP